MSLVFLKKCLLDLLTIIAFASGCATERGQRSNLKRTAIKAFFSQAKGCEYDQEVGECIYHLLEVRRGNHRGEGPSVRLCAVFWSLRQIDSQCGTATGEEIFVGHCSSGEAISAEGRVDLTAEVDACHKGWFCCPLTSSLNCPLNNFDPHHPAIEVRKVTHSM